MFFSQPILRKKKEKIFSNTQSNKSRSSRYKYKLSHISFYKMPKYYNAITSLEKSLNYKKKKGGESFRSIFAINVPCTKSKRRDARLKIKIPSALIADVNVNYRGKSRETGGRKKKKKKSRAQVISTWSLILRSNGLDIRVHIYTYAHACTQRDGMFGLITAFYQ